MALILEVLDARGVRTRHRLETLPLTIGRGLSSDVILDDPYVDASHARISLDASGALTIEDLGSVNGLVANEARLREPVALRAGAELRVGRTTLRVRDSNEPLPPALVDERAAESAVTVASAQPALQASPARPIAPPVPVLPPFAHAGEDASRASVAALPRSRRRDRVVRWTTSTQGRLLISALALLGFSAYSWSGSYVRSSASDVFTGTLVFAIMAAIWAGIWSVASRVSVQRFHFVGHFAVISAMAVIALGLAITDEWLTFFFPDAGLVMVPSTVAAVLLLTTLVAWHLSLSSTMPRRRRWRAGFIVTVTVFAIGALATFAEDDSFTDVPTFSGVVKPVAAGWVPTATVEDFGGVMLELKDEVDEMAREMAER